MTGAQRTSVALKAAAGHARAHAELSACVLAARR